MGILYSLGSINLDFQVRTDRWPVPGVTLPGRDFLMDGGGKAANVAYLARRLEVPSRLFAAVGEDPLADLALKPLRLAGVDLRSVRRVPGQTTGVALIVVGPDADKAITLAPNANGAWSGEAMESVVEALSEGPEGSILVADLEVPGRVVLAATDAARRAGIPILLDPSPADRMEETLFPLVDFIAPNPKEAEALTGTAVKSPESAFAAGDRLRERGIRTALVKLGSGGCVVVGEGVREHVPAPEVEPVDKTGAGDAFAGAFAVAWMRGLSLLQAAEFAVAVSTAAVTRYGSQAAYPRLADLGPWAAKLKAQEESRT